MYPCNSGPFSVVSQNFENQLDDLKDDSLKEEKLQASRPQCAMEDEFKEKMEISYAWFDTFICLIQLS